MNISLFGKLLANEVEDVPGLEMVDHLFKAKTLEDLEEFSTEDIKGVVFKYGRRCSLVQEWDSICSGISSGLKRNKVIRRVV